MCKHYDKPLQLNSCPGRSRGGKQPRARSMCFPAFSHPDAINLVSLRKSHCFRSFLPSNALLCDLSDIRDNSHPYGSSAVGEACMRENRSDCCGNQIIYATGGTGICGVGCISVHVRVQQPLDHTRLTITSVFIAVQAPIAPPMLPSYAIL